MRRPLSGGEQGDIDFAEGQFMPISFANWDGSNGEVGSKHTLSTWYWLLLPAGRSTNVYIYGMPLGVALLVFLAGIFARSVHSVRKT